MDEFFGLRPTGRQLKDPAGTLVELHNADDLKHTAIVSDYSGHPDVALNIRLVLSFLQFPMVTGLVELSHHDIERGVFVYPTGPIWTLKELLRMHAERSQVMGVRASLELGLIGAQILMEAAATGPQQGCFSHGGLTPWRLAFRPDGHLQVFGYGLPPADLFQAKTEPEISLSPDAIRYAPPERLAGEPEQLTSDTYTLALLVHEVATGKPLYMGQEPAALRDKVLAGEASDAVRRSKLPRGVTSLLAEVLAPDPDQRPSAEAFIEGMEDALSKGVKGASLEQLLQTTLGIRTQRKARPLRSAPTAPIPRSTSSTPPRPSSTTSSKPDEADPRWSRVEQQRRRRRLAEEDAEKGTHRRRRRRRTSGGSDAAPPHTSTPPAEQPSPPPAPTGRKSTRKSAAPAVPSPPTPPPPPSTEPEATEEKPPVPPPKSQPLREPTGPKPAVPPPKEPFETPRQRRARRRASRLGQSGDTEASVDPPAQPGPQVAAEAPSPTKPAPESPQATSTDERTSARAHEPDPPTSQLLVDDEEPAVAPEAAARRAEEPASPTEAPAPPTEEAPEPPTEEEPAPPTEEEPAPPTEEEPAPPAEPRHRRRARSAKASEDKPGRLVSSTTATPKSATPKTKSATTKRRRLTRSGTASTSRRRKRRQPPDGSDSS